MQQVGRVQQQKATQRSPSILESYSAYWIYEVLNLSYLLCKAYRLLTTLWHITNPTSDFTDVNMWNSMSWDTGWDKFPEEAEGLETNDRWVLRVYQEVLKPGVRMGKGGG
jgi:hypothetical protein